ncbi:MAG: conjugative transposon protein TraM [Chitinophagales bacterium]|nr:conjugative transposon protein TraM [Chitinophagales bacterium]
MKQILNLKGKSKWMLLMIGLIFTGSLVLGLNMLLRSDSAKKEIEEKGLNPDLPGARLKEEQGMDKLGFYEQADKDSARISEWMRSDPYYKEHQDSLNNPVDELEELTEGAASKYNQRLRLSPYQESGAAPEAELLRKLSRLQKELAQQNENPAETPETLLSERGTGYTDTDLKKLEGMMNQLQSPVTEDPEINQLSTVMDKILDIQHPERVKNKVAKNTDAVYALRSSSGEDTMVDGFYSWSDPNEPERSNTIEARVYGDQVLVNGSVIKFRLTAPVYINGISIPVGTYINGIATLNNERLEIVISTVRSGKSVYAVQLEVYDMDGLPGIYIPGAITRDAARQSAEQSIQLLELRSLDPGIKTQAAATGAGALKNLLTRKVKLQKVLVKSGYQVLFKNKSNL